MNFCIDCKYCRTEAEPLLHLCMRPITNPVTGVVSPLDKRCADERTILLVGACGPDGKLFAKGAYVDPKTAPAAPDA